MNRTARLGIVTTGQGPRTEYVEFHRRLLASMGVSVEVADRHILDGLTDAELERLAPSGDEPVIHCNVRSPGSKSRLGPGWRDVWITRAASVPRVQACIDDLENQEHVDVTIYCVGEEYPPGTFHSRRPLILPYRVMLAYAESIADSKPNATLGVLVYGPRQRMQQLHTWQRQPWATKLKLEFAELGDTPLKAVEMLRLREPDLVFSWGYGLGLPAAHQSDLIDRIEGILGLSLIMPQNVAALFARNFLQPSISGRRYSQPMEGGR